MPTTTVFPVGALAPTYTLPCSVEPSLLISKFGDGYVQRSPDGINFIQKSWTLKWENLTKNERDTIADFFQTQGGYLPFLWTYPGESSPTQVLATNWTYELVEKEVYTITCTFTICYTP